MDMSVPAPHDLILFAAESYDAVLPEWVDRVDGNAWAVVRRQAPADAATIAAGVRGRSRAERSAIDVLSRHVIRRVAPESLAGVPLPAGINPGLSAALAALADLTPIWSAGRAWGPTGSAGFELATGIPVVRASSDLDLLVRAEVRVSRAEARSMLAMLASLPCRVDCLLETGIGAVALAEWAASDGHEVLIRTSMGPRLTSDPWAGAPMASPA